MIDRLQLPRSKRPGKAVMVVGALAAAFIFRGELGNWIGGDPSAAMSSAPATFYTCPMDPSVESDHPSACPICGMALTPVTQEERKLGLVRVAAKSRKLIGLEVAPVEKRTLRRRVVASGAVVEPAPALYQVAIEARIYRGDASALRRGEPVVVTARDVPLIQFSGAVASASATGPRALRVVVENPEQLLRVGMAVEVTVDAELAPRLAVPSSAVLYAGKRRLVFVERSSGVFEPRTPALGMSSDGLVEIVGGLSEGERVAVSGTFLLAAENRIRSDGALWADPPEPTPVKRNTTNSPQNGRP